MALSQDISPVNSEIMEALVHSDDPPFLVDLGEERMLGIGQSAVSQRTTGIVTGPRDGGCADERAAGTVRTPSRPFAW